MAVLKVQVQPAQRGDLPLPQSLAQIGLTRTLLHNALKHRPAGGRLTTTLASNDRQAALTQADSAPALPTACGQRWCSRFQAAPLATTVETPVMTSLTLPAPAWAAAPAWGWPSAARSWSRWAGSLTLHNRFQHGRIAGPDATVRLPLADNPAP